MEEEPERLAEVRGISERIAREIAVQVIEKKDMREAFVFLQQYGISNSLAVKIYNRYGMELYGVMKEIHTDWQRTLKEWDFGSPMGLQPRSEFTQTPIIGSEAGYCILF